MAKGAIIEAREALEELLTHSKDYHESSQEFICDTDYDRSCALAESSAELTVVQFERAEKAIKRLDKEVIEPALKPEYTSSNYKARILNEGLRDDKR